MISTSHRRWLAAAGVALAAPAAPQTAHAGDDFHLYSTRAEFEAALGTSHVVTPSTSGVGFSTTTTGIGATISGPTTYAPGALHNLFGSVESIGYTYSDGLLSKGFLTMSLPNGTTAFGFDYNFRPSSADADVYVTGSCSWGCTTATESKELGSGSGFFGVIAYGPLNGAADVDLVKIGGEAGKLQVANLTFAGPGDVTVTPEPGTIALLGTGLAALAGFGAARRRKQSVES